MKGLKRLNTQQELKEVLLDYFERKIANFVYDEKDKEEFEKEVTSIVTSCVEELIGNFKYYDSQVDFYLEQYELQRREEIEERFEKYGVKDTRH